MQTGFISSRNLHKTCAALLGVLCATLPLQAGVLSQPIVVTREPGRHMLWRTAPSGAFPLRWATPAGATNATLQVAAEGYSRTYDGLTNGSLELTLPEPTSVEDERVYALALAFDNGVVKRTTLGAVATKGGQEASTDAIKETANAWLRIRSPLVVPIPCGTTSLTLDGEPVETGLDGDAGWHAFRGGRSGELVLTAPPHVYTADLLAIDCLLIIIR
ncbi:MAG: hypothetical protein ACOX9C_02950 [Kiritimatiellia bacterium]